MRGFANVIIDVGIWFEVGVKNGSEVTCSWNCWNDDTVNEYARYRIIMFKLRHEVGYLCLGRVTPEHVASTPTKYVRYQCAWPWCGRSQH